MVSGTRRKTHMLDIYITEVEGFASPFHLLACGRDVGSYRSLEAALSSARHMSPVGDAFVIRLRRLDGTMQVLAASLGRTLDDGD